MITGHQGQFSRELEQFWLDVERKFKACDIQMIPQDAIPIWHERSVDLGIPLAPVAVSTATVATTPASPSAPKPKREPVAAA
jgi:hypothetical protein